MTTDRNDPSVIVIGAGMTGIMLVIKLKQAGFKNITLLEKKDSVGGTWRENTYPGVACDVPAHAYTYSFAPNPEWSGLFAPGDEIHRYFIKVFKEFGVDKHTHFNEGVVSSSYNNGKWTVDTTKGRRLEADLLFASTGMLHQPVTPEFEGHEDFKGASFHSAQWDHSVDLAGKRIGIIGTGSSSAQLTPELINRGDTEVTVFQRTAQWLVEADNKPYTEKQKQKFRTKPASMQRVKDFSLALFEKGTTALTSESFVNKVMLKLMAWNAKRYLNSSVKDPVLRDKLTPDYAFGCKRVVLNSTFYDAIQKPNAHLEVNGIARFEENGIRTRDGKLHELDVVVFATGFNPLAYMRPMDFTGRNGLSIEEAWKSKVQAYRSICLPEFPNFFLMLGPNSPIGNYSVIAISEVQANFALQLIKQWQSGRIETIEVKQQAFSDWNAMMKARMAGTVWSSGCTSWYLDEDGDPLTWPDTWKNWLSKMQQPIMDDFHTKSPSDCGVTQSREAADSQVA